MVLPMETIPFNLGDEARDGLAITTEEPPPELTTMVQEVAPCKLVYPVGQGVAWYEPVLAANDPAGARVQVAWPISDW